MCFIFHQRKCKEFGFIVYSFGQPLFVLFILMNGFLIFNKKFNSSCKDLSQMLKKSFWMDFERVELTLSGQEVLSNQQNQKLAKEFNFLKKIQLN